MSPPLTLARSAFVRVVMVTLAGALWSLWLPHSVRAQVELYRRAGDTEATVGFRFAAANERWFVLERDRDTQHQEVLVLRARDGVEVLRTEGMSLPVGARHSVTESWDMTMQPYLSGDRLITFREGEVLVALDIPSGRELWRIPLPSARMVNRALTVTATHVAWADSVSGLRVFDARTGRLVWQAPMRPHMAGGCVALESDGSASALTWDFELVSWSAAGVEQSRVVLQPDWGTYSLLRSADLAVVLGSAAHVVDIRAGRIVAESVVHEWTSGAFVGDELVLGSDLGIEALAPRTLRARWRSRVQGFVAVVTPSALGVAVGNGLLLWLDPHTGETRLTMSVGEPRHVHRYRPRPSWGTAPSAATPSGDVVLIRDSGAGFIAFATPARSPARWTRISGVLRINGRGRRGVLMQVGDQHVRSGAGGRFSTRVALHGVIRVSVSAEELQRRARLPRAREVIALLDPAAPQPITLDAGARDYECDAACTCD